MELNAKHTDFTLNAADIDFTLNARNDDFTLNTEEVVMFSATVFSEYILVDWNGDILVDGDGNILISNEEGSVGTYLLSSVKDDFRLNAE